MLGRKRRELRFAVRYGACNLQTLKAGDALESWECKVVSGVTEKVCVQERIREVPLYGVCCHLMYSPRAWSRSWLTC